MRNSFFFNAMMDKKDAKKQPSEALYL